MRVEKLERRLALTAGLLETAAYVDQESPYFHMSVLEGSTVERQIAFDIPWESVNRRDQVVLDFSIGGNRDVVTGLKLRDLTAWQAVHDKIIVGPAPLATRTASGIDRFGNHLSFEEQVSVATVANITTDHFGQLDAGGMGSNEATVVQPDYLVTRNQDASTANAQAVFARGLGRPYMEGGVLEPPDRFFDQYKDAAPVLLENGANQLQLGGAGPLVVTVGYLPSRTYTRAFFNRRPDIGGGVVANDFSTAELGYGMPIGSEGGPYLPQTTTVFSPGPLHNLPNNEDRPIDPTLFTQYSELTFVTRFIATVTFDVTGTVGDFSEITLTVNPNDSISFAEQIELGSLNIVDSFVIESDGNEAVTRTIDGGISVGGRPLMMGGKRVPERFNGWSIIGAEAVDGENVVFARRGNGTMHRLVADTNWALHGFSSVRNMHSSELNREARFAGSPSLRQISAFVVPTDSEQLWNSVASQLLADGIVTADVAECISHAHTFDQQTAWSADTYISEQELLAAAPTQVNTFEFPFGPPTETFTFTSSGGGGVMGGGSSPVEVTLQTALTPPPDHLVHLTLYEWDLTATESDEANLASLQKLLSEHAFTAAEHFDERHSDAGLDQLDCGYMVFHNTLRPAGGFYGTTTGGNTGSRGTNNNAGEIGSGGATSGSSNSNFLFAAGSTQVVNAGSTQVINAGDTQVINLALWASTSVEESVALAYTKSETLLRVFRWHQNSFNSFGANYPGHG